MDDWRTKIAVAHLVRQRVAEFDIDDLWPFHLPEVAATSEQISKAEDAIGELLDDKYRAFLGYANGWKAFYQSFDLFGTLDLCSERKIGEVMQLLATLEPLEPLCGENLNDLLPIAACQHDIDVFAIVRKNGNRPGEVLWLAGGLIDRYPNFDEFFLAMVDYNRETAKELEKKLDQQSS